MWKKKLLSQRSKEVLIKAVTPSIPTYVMSYLNFLDCFCPELESFVTSFWWGQKMEEWRIQWISQNKLCASKFHGITGFKDIKTSNLAPDLKISSLPILLFSQNKDEKFCMIKIVYYIKSIKLGISQRRCSLRQSLDPTPPNLVSVLGS